MYATPKAMKVKTKNRKYPQEMRNETFRVPRIAGPSAGENVGVGQWKAIDFPVSGRGRLRAAEAGSICDREETKPMEMITPVNPMAEILGHLLPLVPLAKRWLEKQVGEVEQGPERREPLTPKEASVLLKLHVQTVLDWCREGKLDAVKIGGNKANGKGGKFLIPREAIDAYIAQQRLIHGSRKGGAK